MLEACRGFPWNYSRSLPWDVMGLATGLAVDSRGSTSRLAIGLAVDLTVDAAVGLVMSLAVGLAVTCRGG